MPAHSPVPAPRDDQRDEADGLVEIAERTADQIDDAVPAAPELENTVLVDEQRVVRLAGPLFALLSLCLLPWTAFLAIALPSRELAAHYDVAWAGFDIMLLAGLAATAYFALRRSRYLSLAATATGTMLIIDAWFDVLTSRSSARLVALAFAVAVELPLSALCWWLAIHTQEIAEQRIALLLRGRRVQATR